MENVLSTASEGKLPERVSNETMETAVEGKIFDKEKGKLPDRRGGIPSGKRSGDHR